MNKFGKASLIISSLVLPLTTLLSSTVEWYFKSNNPNNVDITSNLAYLKQVLCTALVAYAALWIIGLITALVGLKKDQDTKFSKLALLILPLVLIISILAGAATKAVSDSEDAYRDQKAQEFFEKF